MPLKSDSEKCYCISSAQKENPAITSTSYDLISLSASRFVFYADCSLSPENKGRPSTLQIIHHQKSKCLQQS